MSETTPVDLNKKRIPCDVYSRVVGYITPTRLWNRGKQQEWRERRVYRSLKQQEQ